MPVTKRRSAELKQRTVKYAEQVRTATTKFDSNDNPKDSNTKTKPLLKIIAECCKEINYSNGGEGDPLEVATVLLNGLSASLASSSALWSSYIQTLAPRTEECGAVLNNKVTVSTYDGFSVSYPVIGDDFVDITTVGDKDRTPMQSIQYGKLQSWLADGHFTRDPPNVLPIIEVADTTTASILRALRQISADCVERVRLSTNMDAAKLVQLYPALNVDWKVGTSNDGTVYVQRQSSTAHAAQVESFAGEVKAHLENAAECHQNPEGALLYNIANIKSEKDELFHLSGLTEVYGDWTLLSAIVQYEHRIPNGRGNHFVNITATGGPHEGEYTCYDDYNVSSGTLRDLTTQITHKEGGRARTPVVKMVVYMKTTDFKPLNRLPHGFYNPDSSCWVSSAVLFVMSVQNMWPEAPVPVGGVALNHSNTPRSEPNVLRSDRPRSAGKPVASVHSISADVLWTVELVNLSDKPMNAPKVMKCLETYVDTENCRVYIANNEPGDAIDLCNEIVYVMMASGHRKFCVDSDLQAKFEECNGVADAQIWRHVAVLDLTGKRINRSRAVLNVQENWKANLHNVNLTVWDAMQLHDECVDTGGPVWKDLSEEEQTTFGEKYATEIKQAYTSQEDGVNTRSSVTSTWSSCSYEEQHDFIQSIISGDVSLSNAVVATASPLNSDDDSSGDEDDDSEDENDRTAMEKMLAKEGERPDDVVDENDRTAMEKIRKKRGTDPIEVMA